MSVTNMQAATQGALGALKNKMGALKNDNDVLRDENDMLKREVEKWKDQVSGVGVVFSYSIRLLLRANLHFPDSVSAAH